MHGISLHSCVGASEGVLVFEVSGFHVWCKSGKTKFVFLFVVSRLVSIDIQKLVAAQNLLTQTGERGQIVITLGSAHP